jgi:hypothetical protein
VHRAGKTNIPADSVSRLLQWGEKSYVYTRDMLQDDIGPLSAEEKVKFRTLFKKDADQMIYIADDYRSKIRTKIAENPEVSKEKLIKELYVDAEETLAEPEVSIHRIVLERENELCGEIIMNRIYHMYEKETEERRGELAGRVEYGMFWRPPDEELLLVAEAPRTGGGAKPLEEVSFDWLFFAVSESPDPGISGAGTPAAAARMSRTACGIGVRRSAAQKSETSRCSFVLDA